jgi:hypothetical protein
VHFFLVDFRRIGMEYGAVGTKGEEGDIETEESETTKSGIELGQVSTGGEEK